MFTRSVSLVCGKKGEGRGVSLNDSVSKENRYEALSCGKLFIFSQCISVLDNSVVPPMFTYVGADLRILKDKQRGISACQYSIIFMLPVINIQPLIVCIKEREAEFWLSLEKFRPSELPAVATESCLETKFQNERHR